MNRLRKDTTSKHEYIGKDTDFYKHLNELNQQFHPAKHTQDKGYMSPFPYIGIGFKSWYIGQNNFLCI